jgi:hypothetical protein
MYSFTQNLKLKHKSQYEVPRIRRSDYCRRLVQNRVGEIWCRGGTTQVRTYENAKRAARKSIPIPCRMECPYSSCTTTEMEEAKIEFKGTKLFLHITESKQKELLASTVDKTLTLSLRLGYLTSRLTLRNSPLKNKSLFSIKWFFKEIWFSRRVMHYNYRNILVNFGGSNNLALFVSCIYFFHSDSLLTFVSVLTA